MILVGLSGAGKTTVARLVAAALGSPLCDLDAMVEARAGRTIARLFETDGEAAFISDAGSIDLGTVNAQTRGLVRTVTIASVVIGLFFIWYDVLPALRAFERVELWEITEQTTETVQSDFGLAPGQHRRLLMSGAGSGLFPRA